MLNGLANCFTLFTNVDDYLSKGKRRINLMYLIKFAMIVLMKHQAQQFIE